MLLHHIAATGFLDALGSLFRGTGTVHFVEDQDDHFDAWSSQLATALNFPFVYPFLPIVLVAGPADRVVIHRNNSTFKLELRRGELSLSARCTVFLNMAKDVGNTPS